jgi:hypothetical protein
MNMKMIKVSQGGITTEIPVSDLDFYKKAGYSVVEEKPIAKPEIEDMTLAELKAEAKELGLSGYSTLSKDELLSLLKDLG